MNENKSNTIYTIFLTVTTLILLLFIAVPIIKSAQQTYYGVDYNVTLTLGGYAVKISDATYVSDTKELYFAFSKKDAANGNIVGSEPNFNILSITFRDKNGNETKSDMLKKFTRKSRTEITDVISMSDISDNYLYVYVEVKSVNEAYQEPDYYDEFGNIVQGSSHEKEEFTQYIVIDSTDITVSDSEKEKNKTYEIVNLDTSTADSSTTSSTQDGNVTQKNVSVQNEISASISDSSSKVTTTKKVTDKSSSNTDLYDENVGNTDNAGVQGGADFNTNYDNNGEYIDDGNTEYNNNDDDYDDVINQQKTETQTQAPQQNITTRPTHSPTTTTKPFENVHSIAIDCNGFDDNNVKLNVNNTHIIYVVLSPENAYDKSVTWSSNRTDIANIDDKGKITAVGKGKAIITVTSNSSGLSASCMVTVS